MSRLTLYTIIFLAAFSPLLRVTSVRVRAILLVLLSMGLYLYGNESEHFLLIAGMALGAYATAFLLSSSRSALRYAVLVLGLLVTLGPLLWFKIGSFGTFSMFGLPMNAPFGLSFISLMLAAYVIDVFKDAKHREHSLENIFSFSFFFPSVAAGPISRHDKILPQLKAPSVCDYSDFTAAYRRIAVGIFLKVVIADRLAISIARLDAAGIHNGSALALLLAAYLYSFQLYADFVAYSHLAIGTASLCGVTLPENFDMPYRSASLSEFWKRWHISLSTWLRDYIYFPLGGGRVSTWRKVLNILIVFLISGLWHGSNWTFLVWGFLHGLWQSLEYLTATSRSMVKRALFTGRISWLWHVMGIIITFHFVTAAWIFFRAPNLESALRTFRNISTAFSHSFSDIYVHRTFSVAAAFLRSGMSIYTFAFLILVIALWQTAEWLWDRPEFRKSFFQLAFGYRWTLYYLLLLTIAVFGMYEKRPFIYTGF